MCGERANAVAFREAGGSDQKGGEQRVQTDVVIDAKRTEGAQVAIREIIVRRWQNQSRQLEASVKRRGFRQQHLRNRWLDFRLSGSRRSS